MTFLVIFSVLMTKSNRNGAGVAVITMCTYLHHLPLEKKKKKKTNRKKIDLIEYDAVTSSVNLGRTIFFFGRS